MRKALSRAFVLGLFVLAQETAFAKNIPPSPLGAPQYCVLDEPGSLSQGGPGVLAALQRILTSHDHLNGEQIVLAIFSDLGGEDPEGFSHRVFDEWKVGLSGGDNGALLAIYAREHEARIVAGSALEDTLGEATRARILSTAVAPELSHGNISRASAIGILQILEALHSPLTSTGKAQGILKAGGFAGSFEPVGNLETASRIWWLALVLGLAIFAWAGFSLSAAEAHFTSGGWFRPRPWRVSRWKLFLASRRRASKPETLGGSHGSW
jgi:uncharacterized protein